jgi:hypothetical protein
MLCVTNKPFTLSIVMLSDVMANVVMLSFMARDSNLQTWDIESLVRPLCFRCYLALSQYMSNVCYALYDL